MNTTDNVLNDAWIETHSGVEFHPFNPQDSEIVSEDIAHALSQICRFTGHTKWFYSVAQHCIICAEMARLQGCAPLVQLRALLHDASEAYICDISRPVKQFMPEYREAESFLQARIYQRYGINPIDDEAEAQVKQIDDAVLHMEARTLMPVASWATLPGIPRIESLIILTPISIIKEIFVHTLSILLEDVEEWRKTDFRRG
jgi:uncharacterized protein